ncbi:hypothetical protein C8R48DRAFT_678462 [Suillus tomentosus]|nr:hypothetical protein C8R48DRAFT_678462 [Suillus tomentosus]
MEMEMEDAQQEKQARWPPAPNFKKVSEKSGARRAVSSQSQPKTSCQAEASPDTGMDSDCTDQNHTNNNEHSPPAKVSKAEKLRRDINTAKFELGQKRSLSKQHAYSDNEGCWFGQGCESKKCALFGGREEFGTCRATRSRQPSQRPLRAGCEAVHDICLKANSHKKLISNAPCVAPVLSSSDEENASDKHRSPLVEIDDVKQCKVQHESKNSQKKQNLELSEEDEVSAVEVDKSQLTCEPHQKMPVYEGDSDRKSSSTLKGNKLSKDEVGDTRLGKDKFKKDNGPQMEPDDGLDEDYEDDEELMRLPDKATSSHKNTRLQPPLKTFSAEEWYRNIDDSRQESDNSLDDHKLTSRPVKAKLSLTKGLIRPYLHLYKIDPLAKIEELLAQLSSNDEDDLSEAPRGRRIKFTKSDLPAGSHHKFDSHIVPMWIDFISCLDNIWDISDYADEMQDIWDRVFPNIMHIVLKKNDPVYKLLMQRAYDYRSDFEGSARGTEDCRGAFEDACILDVFALYLENVHNLPKEFRRQSMPKGALAIATAAVERAWKMWSTGTYVKPKRAAHSQFAEGLWNDRTALVMESLDKASRRKWKKIFKGAKAFIDAHKKWPSRRAQAQRNGMGTNGRAACIKGDSGMDSGSDIC